MLYLLPAVIVTLVIMLTMPRVLQQAIGDTPGSTSKGPAYPEYSHTIQNEQQII